MHLDDSPNENLTIVSDRAFAVLLWSLPSLITSRLLFFPVSPVNPWT